MILNAVLVSQVFTFLLEPVLLLLSLLLPVIALTNEFIVGDFNLPNIDWSVPISLNGLSPAYFSEFCNNCNIIQLVQEPNCDSGNTLDLLLSDSVSLTKLISFEVDTPFSHSCDHSSLLFEVQFKPSLKKGKPPVMLDFRKAHYSAVREELFCVDRACMISSSRDNVQLLYDTLLHQLHLIISYYVPTKSPKAKSKTPSHIRKLLRKKRGSTLRAISLLKIKSSIKGQQKPMMKLPHSGTTKFKT